MRRASPSRLAARATISPTIIVARRSHGDVAYIVIDTKRRAERVMVITEFDAGDPEATMHAMARELFRRAAV